MGEILWRMCWPIREQARSHIRSHFSWKNSVNCGSGLAREEASLGNTKPGQKKPPVNPLRIGDAAG
jgi:hypothetical protein